MPNIQLFDNAGNRKYLSPSERIRFEEAANAADGDTATFCLMLLYTGCRISEALNLRVRHIDLEAQSVTFETLKQRRDGIFRQVPLPEGYLRTLRYVHGIEKRQGSSKTLGQFIWTSIWNKKPKQWSRKTAYSRVMSVMVQAELEGVKASPKGLRHGFAIACLDKGIPINLVQKWMGHSSITTTAIYANATGEEERSIAARLWGETVTGA
jgi:integrase